MPSLPFEWIVALRFLREGRMQTLLIVAGTTVGVAVIIFITALVNGLQASLADRSLSTQAHVTVRPPEDEARRAVDADSPGVVARVEPRAQRLRSIDQWERILPEIERMPHVTAASPVAQGAGFALRANASKPIVLLGIDPARYRRIVKVDEQMVAGRYRITPGEAMIGTVLADDLGAGVGDRIRIQTAEGGDDIFQVTGIFDVGYKDLNRRWVMVPLKTAQSLLNLPGGVTNIDLTVDDIFAAQQVADRIASSTGLLADSWMVVNTQLLAAFRNQNMTTRLIRIFLVLIVALGIASVLVVSVVQKQKEIGILRAMGTSPARIMGVFLIQGAVVGAIGAVLGSVLAIGLVKGASYVLLQDDGTSLITGDIDPLVHAGAAVVALVTGVLAAIAPARRAAKMDPVQAIRG
jgi:lipoprotein-releasing system permease protein